MTSPSHSGGLVNGPAHASPLTHLHPAGLGSPRDPAAPSTPGAALAHGPRVDLAAAPRTAVQWASLCAALAELAVGRPEPLRVLDVGGGTGGFAVPLAQLGYSVTVLDPSPDALAALARRAQESGVAEQIQPVQADASELDSLPELSVDALCCHGVLEDVDEPEAALRSMARALRPGGVLSLVVAQRTATVLARALLGRFNEARQVLSDDDGRWGPGDPLPRRFDAAGVRSLAQRTGFTQVH
ncbi:MAG: class I SAM-dependent methyltransferase, partial [Angustibacter sp.]